MRRVVRGVQPLGAMSRFFRLRAANRRNYAVHFRESIARVSKRTGKQDTENQLGPLREFANTQNWTLGRESIDQASGRHCDRDECSRSRSLPPTFGRQLRPRRSFLVAFRWQPTNRVSCDWQRIETSNQAFPGKVWMSDLDQIGLIEESHLQLAASSQFLDLGGA